MRRTSWKELQGHARTTAARVCLHIMASSLLPTSLLAGWSSQGGGLFFRRRGQRRGGLYGDGRRGGRHEAHMQRLASRLSRDRRRICRLRQERADKTAGIYGQVASLGRKGFCCVTVGNSLSLALPPSPPFISLPMPCSRIREKERYRGASSESLVATLPWLYS